MRKSRLGKRVERRNVATIVLSLFGMGIVLFLLFKFGLAMLVNLSLFLSGQGNQDGNVQNQINFIPAPVLNPIPNATNSAKVIVTGKSVKGFTISLYINNENKDQAEADENGNFTFTENLDEGNNQIKAVAKKEDKNSDFSNTLNILLKSSQPDLTITFPSEGQSFKKEQNSVNVTGNTDPGTTVTVNGFWAIIDENNNFSYNLILQGGDNQIKVLATDQAGNQSEKTIKVNYSQ